VFSSDVSSRSSDPWFCVEETLENLYPPLYPRFCYRICLVSCWAPEIAFAFASNQATWTFSPHFDKPLPRPRRKHNRLKSCDRVKPVLNRDQCCNYLLCGRISRSERSSRLLRDPRAKEEAATIFLDELNRSRTWQESLKIFRTSFRDWTKRRGIIRKSSSDRNLFSELFVYAMAIELLWLKFTFTMIEILLAK